MKRKRQRKLERLTEWHPPPVPKVKGQPPPESSDDSSLDDMDAYPKPKQVVSDTLIKGIRDQADEFYAMQGIKPSLYYRIAIAVADVLGPRSEPTRMIKYDDGSIEFVLSGGQSTGGLAGQATIIIGGAAGATRVSQGVIGVGRELLEEAGQVLLEETTGLPLDAVPTRIRSRQRAARSGASGESGAETGWLRGRYSDAASDPGAYWNSGKRVFPTTRNSTLRSADLRKEQQQFFARGLAEGKVPGQLRGQASSAGYERRGGANRDDDHLADRGAEKALQDAIRQQSSAE